MICRIIAGDYEKCNLMIHQPFLKKEIIYICVGFNKKNWIKIDRETVDEYELITEESTKSVKSAVGRAFVGGILLGGVGLLAGVTAKSKGIYRVAIQFKDGKRSMLEVDDRYYKKIMEILF
jgi:hypothetical protein